MFIIFVLSVVPYYNIMFIIFILSVVPYWVNDWRGGGNKKMLRPRLYRGFGQVSNLALKLALKLLKWVDSCICLGVILSLLVQV